jgi:hypothetical protein
MANVVYLVLTIVAIVLVWPTLRAPAASPAVPAG